MAFLDTLLNSIAKRQLSNEKLSKQELDNIEKLLKEKRLQLRVNKQYEKLKPVLKDTIPDLRKKLVELESFRPMLRTPSQYVRPLAYQHPILYETLSRKTHWMFQTIDMLKDTDDYEHNMLESEKATIGSILKGFAQTETFVCDYWNDFICVVFPRYEMKVMGRNFSDRENIHSEAYNSLAELVNISKYAEFTREPGIAEKLDLLTDISHFKDVTEMGNLELCTKIGYFAALEGACLMPSFSVLMSFNTRIKTITEMATLPEGIPAKRLKGITAQMTWSVRDELLHARAACWIFNQLCKECEHLNLREIAKEEVREGMMVIYQAELDYLNKIFEHGDLPTIKRNEVENLVKYRLEVIWNDLGYEDYFFGENVVDSKLLDDMKWFFDEIGTQKYNDNFVRHDTNYNEVENFKERLFKNDTISKLMSEEELEQMKKDLETSTEEQEAWNRTYEASHKFTKKA